MLNGHIENSCPVALQYSSDNPDNLAVSLVCNKLLTQFSRFSWHNLPALSTNALLLNHNHRSCNWLYWLQ